MATVTGARRKASIKAIAAMCGMPMSSIARLIGVEAVIHLAAKVGLGVAVSDLPDYASSNDVGAAELLAGMARAEISRLTLASSMVVYGEGEANLRRAWFRAPGAAPGSFAGIRQL